MANILWRIWLLPSATFAILSHSSSLPPLRSYKEIYKHKYIINCNQIIMFEWLLESTQKNWVTYKSLRFLGLLSNFQKRPSILWTCPPPLYTIIYGHVFVCLNIATTFEKLGTINQVFEIELIQRLHLPGVFSEFQELFQSPSYDQITQGQV